MKKLKITLTFSILFTLIAFPLVGLNNNVKALTSGPNNPATATSVSGWSNISNATASDDQRATYQAFSGALGATQTTNSSFLELTNFGFSIPTNSIINGITVDVERSYFLETGGQFITDSEVQDNSIQIIKNGSIVGDNKATSSLWTTSDQVATYGGVSDVWGEVWTSSDINSSDFGIAISSALTLGYVTPVSGGGTQPYIEARVDSVTISVDYSPSYFITNLDPNLDVIDSATSNLVELGGVGTNDSNANLNIQNTQGIRVANINVDMTMDRDWIGVIGDSDTRTKKSFTNNLVSAPGTSSSYDLYVPKDPLDFEVYVCPTATSFVDVTEGCSGEVRFNSVTGDMGPKTVGTATGVTASTTNINGQDYWIISGVEGTGAGSISGSAQTPQMRVVLRDSEAISTVSDLEFWFDTPFDLTANSILYINYEGGEFTGGANITTSDVTVTCDTDGIDPLSGTTMTNTTVVSSDNGVLELDTGTDTCADWLVVDINGDGGNSLTNPSSSGNYSWSILADAGGDTVIDNIGATLAYVADDNDVNITAVVPPVIDMELYQQNSDTELTDPNTCSLGVLSLNTVNTCIYDLGTGTNNATGVSVYITSDGPLDDGFGNDINNTTGTVDAGSEEYGFYISDLGGGEYTAAGSFSTAHQPVPTTATLLATTADTGNGTTLGQSVQHLEITHAASMSTDTIVGSYSQIVTFTAYTN